MGHVSTSRLHFKVDSVTGMAVLLLSPWSDLEMGSRTLKQSAGASPSTRSGLITARYSGGEKWRESKHQL